MHIWLEKRIEIASPSMLPAGKCTIAAQRRARAAVATPAATTPAATAALKGSGNKAMDDAINAIRKNNNKKNNNNMAATNTTGARQAITQQTLRCNFGTISTPQEIRFTATGSSLGTFTNVATVTFTGSDSPKDATATVTVVSVQRLQRNELQSLIIFASCKQCQRDLRSVIHRFTGLRLRWSMHAVTCACILLCLPASFLCKIQTHISVRSSNVTPACCCFACCYISNIFKQINPPRQQGSCCDGSYSCRTNVDEASCTSSGGTWSSSSTACNTKMFCSGACCTGGNTAEAYCRLTKKNKCGGGLRFAAGAWDPNGDCNDPTFCPKVRTDCTSRGG